MTGSAHISPSLFFLQTPVVAFASYDAPVTLWYIPDRSYRKEALDARNAKEFEKPSFGSPDLVAHLARLNESEGIEEITLIGICTDICVLTNAISLKCFLPEVKLTIEPKLCAGVTNDRHNVALEAMQFCQIYLE